MHVLSHINKTNFTIFYNICSTQKNMKKNSKFNELHHAIIIFLFYTEKIIQKTLNLIKFIMQILIFFFKQKKTKKKKNYHLFFLNVEKFSNFLLNLIF